ncbi:uncharacterized protein LOC108225050 isoform X2 [Daucus carota subsp. sativus]|uniref:uncharacterized protein LOC108225050 isoform X2 n=1 Tax=Daucus carota subsp. sativus TaxID=79200 RepID=UPI0007EF1075|nr:PREDICTED: uncharacterized protein LOC108225050 isoform X2 [Daucus carota subsp. sativus]
MGSNGVWCSNCAISLRPHVTDDAKLCCSFCGKVVGECNWSEEVISFDNADQQCKRKLGIPGTDRDDNMHLREDDKNGDTTKHMASDYSDYDDSHGSNIMSGESDTFSDIDDLEIDSYIHSKKEQHYKKIIWEELNREYIEGRRQKRAEVVRNPVIPRIVIEATRQMLAKKDAKTSRFGEGAAKANP